MIVRRGIGDVSSAAGSVAGGAAGAAAGVFVPVGSGPGPSNYTINSDGTVTWFDASGNPITNIAAYNSMVNAGDAGPAAMTLPPIPGAPGSTPQGNTTLYLGIAGFVFIALVALVAKR